MLPQMFEHGWPLLAYALGPALAASALVCALLLWRDARPALAGAAAALALAAGFVAGIGPLPWREALLPLPQPWRDGWLTPILRDSLLDRLPLVAAGALVVGWLARLPSVPPWLAWRLRLTASLAAGWLLVPEPMRGEFWWSPLAFGAAVFEAWTVLERRAELSPGAEVPLQLALALGAAAVVILYAPSARLMEAAVVVAGSLAGVGLVALWRGADPRGAVPGAVVLLAGLLLSAYYNTEGDVPPSSFALPALALLAPAVTLLPPLARRAGGALFLLRLALLLVPLGVAVGRAVMSGSLEFE